MFVLSSGAWTGTTDWVFVCQPSPPLVFSLLDTVSHSFPFLSLFCQFFLPPSSLLSDWSFLLSSLCSSLLPSLHVSIILSPPSISLQDLSLLVSFLSSLPVIVFLCFPPPHPPPSCSFPPCLHVAVSLSQGFPSASNTSWRWMTGQKDFSQMQVAGDELHLLSGSLSLFYIHTHARVHAHTHTGTNTHSLSVICSNLHFALSHNHIVCVYDPVCVCACVWAVSGWHWYTGGTELIVSQGDTSLTAV